MGTLTPGPDPLVLAIESAARAAALRRDDDARSALVQIAAPAVVPTKRGTVAYPTQVAVFRRDNFTCRYCDRRTIFLPVLNLLASLYSELPYDPYWNSARCHPVFWTHSTSLDHLVPLARGGPLDDMSNLRTACYLCQTMKSSWLLEELQWLGWRERPSSYEQWDGLSRFHAALYERACKELPPACFSSSQRKDNDRWRAALSAQFPRRDVIPDKLVGTA